MGPEDNYLQVFNLFIFNYSGLNLLSATLLAPIEC